MPIDRHTSGDYFDRSDDTRVNETDWSLRQESRSDRPRDTEAPCPPRRRQVSEAAGQQIIWPLLALGLAACGGGGGTNTLVKTSGPGPGPGSLTSAAVSESLLRATNVKVHVVDGPLKGAKVYLSDADGNPVGEMLGYTDSNGELDLSKLDLTTAQRTQILSNGLVVTLDVARDMSTGETYEAGTLRSVPGNAFNIVSPLTTLIVEAMSGTATVSARDDAAQRVIDTLFGADSGITLDMIQSYLSYQVSSSGASGIAAIARTSIATMSIRVLETLEEMIHRDNRGGSYAERAQRAVKTLSDRIEAVATENDNRAEGADAKDADDVPGVKSESDVKPQTDNSQSYGSGRPVAVPRKGLTVKSGSEDGLKLTLDDLGFGDIERQEEFGAVTFTALPGALGELSYISVATGQKTVVTADTKIIIADVQGGVFTFVPTANVIGEITFTYEVEAKAVGKDYDAGSPVDRGMEKSTSATLSISVTAESGGEIVIAEQTDKDGRADDEAPHPGDRLRADVVAEDGADIAYQWVARTGPTAEWQPLAGHTTRYYVVRDADVGMEIGVRVQRDGGPAFTLLEGVVSSLGLQPATEAQASGPRSPDLVAFAREVDAGWQDDAGAEKSIHLGADWSSYALVDNDTNGANDIIATYDVRIYQLPAAGAIAAARKISGFRSGDKVRLRADGAAEDATDVSNVYYAWADLGNDGVANDLVLYSNRTGGDSNVYVILMDWGVEGGSTPPANNAFWENVANIEEATNAATTADRSAAQEIAYSLATEGPDDKIINHNHLVKEITDGKVIFKAGAFDHEHLQLITDGTGRYVLIQIGRTVNEEKETVNLKIYVTNINDGATDIGLDDDIPDFELPEAPADNARQQERDAHAAQVAALTAKQSSLILPLSGGVYDGSEVVIGVLWVSDPDSDIGPGTRIVLGGDDAGLFTARWDPARGPEGSLILVYTGGTAGVADRKPGDSFDLTVLQIIDDQEGGVPGAAPAVRVLEMPHAPPLVLNGVKAHDSDAVTPDKVQVGAAPTGGALKVRELDFAAVPNRLIDTTDADDDDILDNFRVLNPDGTENTYFHVRFENDKFYLYQTATVDTMPDGGVIDLVVVPNLRKVVPGADWYVAHDADGGVNGFIAIEFNNDLSRLIADKPSSAFKQQLHIPDSGPLELSFYQGSNNRQMKSLTVEHGNTSGIAWSPSSPTTLTVTLGPGEQTFGKLAELIWGSADAVRLLGLEAGRRDPADNSYLKAKLWRLQVEEDGGITAQAGIAVEGALVAINPGRLPSSVYSVKYVEITSGQSSVDVDVQDYGRAGYRITVTFSLLARERTIDKVLELLQDPANKPVADLWKVTDTTTTQQLRGILELDSASEINAAGEIQGRASRSIQRDPNTGRVVINQNTGEPVFVSGPKTLDVRRVDIPQDAQSSLVAPTINAPGLNVRLSITEGIANSLVWDDATRTATITLVKDDDMVESLRNLLVGHDVVRQLMGLAGTHHGQGHDPVSRILSRLQLRVDEADLSQPREALLISLTGGRIHNLVPGRDSGEISFTGATFDLMKFKDDGGNRVPVTLYISQDDGGGWSLKIIKSSEIGNARDHATAPGLAAGADGNDDAQEPAIFHYIVGHIAANGFTISWPDGATAFDAFNYDLIGLTPAPMAVQVPVVNLDGAGDNDRADLSGTAGVADIFTIDADAGTAAGADTITGFEATRDKLQIGDGSAAHTVHVRIAGGDTVIYSVQADARTGADANILAVLTGATVTKAQLDAGLFEGTGAVTIGSIIQVHDGAGDNAKADLSGAAGIIDIFTIDADVSNEAGADTIVNFDPAADRLQIGDGSGKATVTFVYDGGILLYNTDTTGDDAAAKTGKVLATLLVANNLSASGNAFQASDVAGADTVINVHDDGVSSANSQTMQGALTTKDVFGVDGTAGDRASADIIKAFEDGPDIVKVAGDIDIFWHVETVNAGQPDEAKNTILRSTNSDSGDHIIAIIEGFEATNATFDDNDFVGGGAIQEIT